MSAQTVFVTIDAATGRAEDAPSSAHVRDTVTGYLDAQMAEPATRAGSVSAYELWGSVFAGEDRLLLAATADFVQRFTSLEADLTHLLGPGWTIAAVGGYEPLTVRTTPGRHQRTDA